MPDWSAAAAAAEAHQRAGRHAEATIGFREAARLAPSRAEGHFRLAHVLLSAGDAMGALPALQRTLALTPSFTGAWNNLGLALSARSRLPAAAIALKRAIATHPPGGEGWNNLGNLLMQAADPEGAVACYRRAVERDPLDPIAHANLINGIRLVDGVGPEDELAECRRFAERHAAVPAVPLPERSRDPDRRLKIGYVGGDSFRFHTAAMSILPLVESHDPGAVEVVCFSDVPPRAEDEITARFRAAARFVSTLGLTDAAAAEAIAAGGVDIAVDVIGYPRGSRLLALARRPAPVQANLLLMGSFGMEAVGWAIGDDLLTPPGSERHFTERLARIDLAFAYAPLGPVAEISALPAAGGRGVTFGSLNQPSKLSPRCLATWARILTRLPSSRLLLKGRAFGDATIAGRVRAAFAGHGVEARRLDLRAWTMTQASHLDSYRKIDIALDPFPYGGVITTCEAMSMGVPVVSLEGERVLGRYGSAFLKTVDLADLAAKDEGAYVEAAIGLAKDIGRLSGLRRGLRARMAASRLCDAAAFARGVESAYRRMWRDWCRAS